MDDARKRTWAEIDLDRLAHNYRALRALTDPSCRFMGVVKANAYGHGAVAVARELEALGADYLSVACLDEALELRQAGIQAPILILGITPLEYAGALLDHGIAQTVGDLETAEALSRAASAAGKPLTVHLKVDTGMSRLGFLCDEDHTAQTAEAIGRAWALPSLRWEGIFTHFANADGDEAYTMRQFTRFLDLLDSLAARGITFPIRHCASSAAVLNYPCTHLDMIRPGIALYGHYPAPGMEHTCGLEPVMALKSRVAAVRDLPAGTAVSYGCTRVLERDSRVAVLPGPPFWAGSAWTCVWWMSPISPGSLPGMRLSFTVTRSRWRPGPSWRGPSSMSSSATSRPGCPASTWAGPGPAPAHRLDRGDRDSARRKAGRGPSPGRRRESPASRI